MKILALDTALNACSAAIAADGRVVAGRYELLNRGHAERIVPMLEEARREAGLEYRDLDRIAVTVGPGTFTGVRVGLAAARGLALATGLPVAGITTLQALAWNAPEPLPAVAAIDARRGEIYLQMFDAERRPLGEPGVLSPAQAAERFSNATATIVGTGSDLLHAAAPHLAASAGRAEPDAAVIVVHADNAAFAPGADAPMPSPLYLRAPDARLPAAAANG